MIGRKTDERTDDAERDRWQAGGKTRTKPFIKKTPVTRTLAQAFSRPGEGRPLTDEQSGYDGRTEGRTDRRKNGWTNGRMDARTEGRVNGGYDKRTDG